MEAIIRALGLLARTVRPRGRHLVARALSMIAPGRTLAYRDRWGIGHVARLSDPMEALGFVGKPALPTELHRIVGAGDWVIDVGANIGIVTAELCHMVGPAGTVWAFEPFPPSILKLEELERSNRLANLRLFAGALSSGPGLARLGLPSDGNSGHPSLTKTSGLAATIEVTSWSLDELVFREGPDRPLAFVKIDVEGHEPAVLAGAVRTLREMRPLILCEFNDELLREGGSSPTELIATFRDLGYRPVKALKEGRPLGIVASDEALAAAAQVDGAMIDLLLAPNESRAWD